MSKAKIIWASAGSLFLVGALVAGMYLVFQNQNIARQAAPATTLYITPGSQNKSPDNTFNFNVVMSTGTNQSTGFDVVINYNPAIFEVTSISGGSLVSGFTEIKKSIDNTGGKILYSVFTIDTSKALNGSDLTVLSVSAKVKSGVSAGTYNFTFDASTAVAGLGEGQNVLMSTTPGSVVVGGLALVTGATSTPTASPTSTPTATATSSTSATATPTATATATPTTTSTTSSSTSSTTTTTATPVALPVTGASLPTIALGVVGVLVIIASFALAI